VHLKRLKAHLRRLKTFNAFKTFKAFKAFKVLLKRLKRKLNKTHLSKLSGQCVHPVDLVLTALCSSDLITILRGGPYSAVTQLRDNPSCKSSFLEVHLAQGVTFWVPTHAPQPLVTRPGSVSTFLLYHAHGSPLGVALSWVVSVPGVSQRWRGYFTSQVTPYWY